MLKSVLRIVILDLSIISILLIAQNKINTSLIPSSIAFEVDETDLIPEGIAFDPQTDQFFLSSKYKEKIIVADQYGNHSDFIETGQDGMLGSLGLKIDEKRRRLWAVSNKKDGNKSVSAVHVYDIDSKTLIKQFYLPADKKYLLNDLAITNDGSAYITETFGSNLFMVSSDLSEIKLFLNDTLLNEPNGIVLSPDNKLLYVASTYNGILIIDLITNTISPIGNIISVSTDRLDGLVFYNNSIIGVANAQYEFTYVVRYYLSDNRREIIAASIIDKDNPEFITPTTCVIADNNLYVLAATCLAVCINNQMDRKDLLHNPVVLKYQLK